MGDVIKYLTLYSEFHNNLLSNLGRRSMSIIYVVNVVCLLLF